MGYEVRWYREKDIHLTRYFGKVTVEDLIASNAEGANMLEAGAETIHMIIDSTDVTEYPTNLFKVANSVKVKRLERIGWMIVVAKQGSILKFIASTVVQLFALNKQWQVCETFEEALGVIGERAPVSMPQQLDD